MADPTLNLPAGAMPASTGVDLHQEFRKLARDPIVEAVITFACRAQAEWTKDSIAERIQKALPEYPNAQYMNHARVQFNVEFSPQPTPAGGVAPLSRTSTEDLGWMGVRLVSTDQKQVVTMTRDSLAISRLAPYEGWGKLCDEVLRVWRIHRELAGVDSDRKSVV